MYEDLNSLELYKKQYNAVHSFWNPKSPSSKDFFGLLVTMREELLVESYSPLLALALKVYNTACLNNCMSSCRFQPVNFSVEKVDVEINLPDYDAHILMLALADHFLDELPDTKIDKILSLLYGKAKLTEFNSEYVGNALKSIDKAILTAKSKCCEDSQKAEEKTNIEEIKRIEIDEQVKKEVEAKVALLIKEAEEKASMIKNEAEQEKFRIIEWATTQKEDILKQAKEAAEEDRQAILAEAQQQATAIINQANAAANYKRAEAQKRFVDSNVKARIANNNEEHQALQDNFSEIRSALFQTNDMLKKLEDTVSIKNTEKVYSQLIELYNLVADTKDTTFVLARDNNNQDLENAAYNMDVFLDMITEYLADFGIETIVTMPGEPFSGKLHYISNRRQFDPSNAVIKTSLRNGFIWGEQVLQKETVEL